MWRTLAPVLAATALAASACGAPDYDVQAQEPEGPRFFSEVVDVEGAVGTGVSLTADADGTPHLAYLAFEEELPPGAPPAPPDPLAPVLPAVKHAHLVDQAWTRDAVADDQPLSEDDQAAIAVGAEGVHHVAWTSDDGIRYSSNAEGEFLEEPQDVVDADATGISIAVDDRGTPWISYVELLTDPEGPGALVRVATLEGSSWSVETAAEAGPDEPVSTAIGITADGPLVAYGSEGATQVVTRTGPRWTSEEVAEGGLGVSMAVDPDGVPHLAFFDGAGEVRRADPGGGGWAVSSVGSGATGSTTSIAVAEDGSAHVAWQTGDGLAYAAPEGEEELPPQTAGGSQPQVALGPEGAVYLAWYDPQDAELQVAIRADERPLLAVPIPEEGGGGAPVAQCQPDGTELSIEAPPGAITDGFSTNCLAVPAGEAYTIDFNNADQAVPHNISVYTDQTGTEALLEGEIITGPASETLQGEPIDEPGSYFFRCDVHPPTMNGTFVVAEA